MGTYTQLHFNAELGDRLHPPPTQVLAILSHMTGRFDNPSLPEEVASLHPLFQTSRWENMLVCHSYYFPVGHGGTGLEFDDVSSSWYLHVRSSFKNYNQEVQEFLRWVMPYVAAGGDEMLGYWQTEECDPRLIYPQDWRRVS